MNAPSPDWLESLDWPEGGAESFLGRPLGLGPESCEGSTAGRLRPSAPWLGRSGGAMAPPAVGERTAKVRGLFLYAIAAFSASFL
jgi:hypothetical protein